MKQEKNQKSKKWLWLVLALVALLAVAGIVLALVLGGGETPDPAGESGGRPQLYWNIERERYIEEETGMSTRTKGEDGMYHVLFAYDGQQVDLTVADKQIVNFIESMEVMGLAFDADGVVVDVVAPETIATEFAKRFYVRAVTDTAITLNSSYAMNGMEKEVPITDLLGIYDVDPNAELIGAEAVPGVMDEVTVYANDLNEPTHMYIHKRAPEAGVYWRVERMYDTEKGVTTREPDENGVYTILCAHEGELVELKCKDKALVTKIDSAAPLIGTFAFVFDDEGYIVGTENVALALRGKLLAQDYHVMEVNGDQITIERVSSGSDQGKRITFTLSDDCKIYQCCRSDCFEDHCGEPTNHLRQYDRINVYSDLEGNPILIYITIRQVDSPMYYNLKRMYSSANGGGTTREKENGYYVFDMLEEGKQVTLRTKDKAIADAIDYPYNFCVGLDVEGDIITRVYDAQCVSGYYSPGFNRVVTSLTGGIFQLTSATDETVFANCIMAEDCKIYDVTGNPGVKKGTETTLQLGDRVIAWYDYATKVNYIYVTGREVTTRAYCEYCKKTVTWEVAPVNGLGTIDTGKHLHYVVGQDTELTWGYGVLNKGTTLCLNLYGSTIEHTSRIFVAGGSKLNIMGSGGIISNATHKNESLKTGNITVNSGEVNIYGGTIRSLSSKMPSINVNGKEAVVNLLGGSVIGGVDINIGTLNLGGKAKVLGAKGELRDNIYVGTTGKLNVKADWIGEASVKVAIVSDTGISKTFGTSEGEYAGKLYYESKGNPAVIGKDGGLVVVGEIIPDENDPDYRYCEHCGKRVMWSPAPASGHGTLNSGEHIHYYLTEDFTKDWGYVVLQNNTTVCLDLNGHTINQMGRIFLGGATLNIMGEGTVTTRVHKNATLNSGAITVNTGTVNIYGGTYTSDNKNAPAILVNSNVAAVNLLGGKVIGGVRANAGTVTLGSDAAVTGTKGKNIYISNAATLTVLGDWTGTAGVAFSYVGENPIENGSCTGNYTGKLTLEEDNGYQILPQNGKLYIPGYTIKAEQPIEPDFPVGVANGVTSEAWCEVCQRNVIWTSASSGLSTRSDGGHYHFFTSGTRDSSDPLTWQLGTVTSDTTVCLYLNDTETVHNGRLFVSGGSTVNIMGKGILTTNGTNASSSALTGGITANDGVVNVLGDIQLKSTNSAVPAVSVMYGNASVNLTDGNVVAGGAYVGNGTLSLAGKVTADVIAVADMGKLVVDESFTGTAQLVFQSITENPVINGSCTGNYTGTLKTNIEGTDYDVIAQEGKLYISGYTVSGGEEPPAPPVDDGLLHLDADGKAMCEHCGVSVQWTAMTTAQGDKPNSAGTYHYYLTKDIDSGWATIGATVDAKVCLHLNGHTLSNGRRIRTYNGGVLSIMGAGTITGDNENPGTNTQATIEVGWKSTVNVYGGNFGSTADGVPTFVLNSTSATLNLNSGAVTGGITVTSGTLNLGGDTTVDSITVAAAGKLNVKADWTGTAKVTFASALVEGLVPEANGAAEGNFTGILTTADGAAITNQNGRLAVAASADDGKLVLNAENKGYCEACDEIVTWTIAGTNGLSSKTDGTHYHLYLSETYNKTWGYLTLTSGTKMCLHLNGFNIEQKGRIFVSGTGCVLNIMGNGTVASVIAHSNADLNTGSITVNTGVVNLYGGTYTSPVDGIPAITLTTANAAVNVLGGEVPGVLRVNYGVLTLSGEAAAGNITVAEGGKLNVKADWTGTAKVTFASEPVDGMIPAANGAAEGEFTGSLTLADGTKLYADNGKLKIQTALDKEIARAKAVTEAANAMVFPTDGSDYVADCPACGAKQVTWVGKTALSTVSADTHVYMKGNMDVSYGYGTLSAGTLCIHLNGKTLTQGSRLITVVGTTLNIMGNGTLISNGTNTNTSYITGSLTLRGTTNLYGGTYTSIASNGAPVIYQYSNDAAVLNIYDGVVIGGEAGTGVGTNIKLEKGTVNMYGGTVRNGAGFLNTSDNKTYGGNAYLYNGTTFNLYGGTVTGGKAMTGGNICASSATLNIGKYATVSNGEATTQGGNIHLASNSATLYSVMTTEGKLLGGTTTGTAAHGGNISLGSNSVINITGGEITGGTASGQGGALRVYGGKVNMTGGVISGGDSQASINDNVWLAGAATMTMTGGTVKGTDGTDSYGTAIDVAGTAVLYLGGDAKVVRNDGINKGNIRLGTTSNKLMILNNWTGTASAKFYTAQTYGDTIADVNGQCGTLTDGTFTAGGSYDGILIYEDLGCKVAGSEGALVISADPSEDDGVLKILAIGNSFAVDSTNLLYEIYRAENPDKQIVIGVLNKGGASLVTHVNNLTNDTGDYYYHKLDSSIYASTGKWKITNDTSMKAALYDENWDIVTIQQASGSSTNAATYNDNITTIQNYVVQNLGYKPEFAWNFTWGYPDDEELLSTSSDANFAQNFFNNHGTTEVMYNKISAAVQEKIVNGTYSFEYLMPTGTAIQNARSNHLTAKDLYRDSLHLNNLGRFIAAYTWYCEFEGYNGTDKALTDLKLTQIPASLALTTAVSNGVTELDAALEAIVIESVNNALKNKFAVTVVTE